MSEPMTTMIEMETAVRSSIEALRTRTRLPLLEDIGREPLAIFADSEKPLESMLVGKLAGINSDGEGGVVYYDESGAEYDQCLVIADVQLEPEWLEPTNEHVGQTVHVRNHSDSNWRACTLAYVNLDREYPFLSTDDCGYSLARIRNPRYVRPQ